MESRALIYCTLQVWKRLHCSLQPWGLCVSALVMEPTGLPARGAHRFSYKIRFQSAALEVGHLGSQCSGAGQCQVTCKFTRFPLKKSVLLLFRLCVLGGLD